jgi:hypothetical protein
MISDVSGNPLVCGPVSYFDWPNWSTLTFCNATGTHICVDDNSTHLQSCRVTASCTVGALSSCTGLATSSTTDTAVTSTSTYTAAAQIASDLGLTIYRHTDTIIFLPSILKSTTVWPLIILGIALSESIMLFEWFLRFVNMKIATFYLLGLVGACIQLSNVAAHIVYVSACTIYDVDLPTLSLLAMLAAITTCATIIIIYLLIVMMLRVFDDVNGLTQGLVNKLGLIFAAVIVLFASILLAVALLMYSPFIAQTASHQNWIDSPYYYVYLLI